MSYWSDYFDEFPEKNPANWVDGKFDPKLAQRLHKAQHLNASYHDKDNADLNHMIKKVKQETTNALLTTNNHPHYSFNNLKTYLQKYITYVSHKFAEFMTMLNLKH